MQFRNEFGFALGLLVETGAKQAFTTSYENPLLESIMVYLFVLSRKNLTRFFSVGGIQVPCTREFGHSTTIYFFHSKEPQWRLQQMHSWRFFGSSVSGSGKMRCADPSQLSSCPLSRLYYTPLSGAQRLGLVEPRFPLVLTTRLIATYSSASLIL